MLKEKKSASKGGGEGGRGCEVLGSVFRTSGTNPAPQNKSGSVANKSGAEYPTADQPDAQTCSECGSRPRLGNLSTCKPCLITSSELNRRARADAEQRAREKTAAKQIAEGKVKPCKCCGETKPLASFATWPTAKDRHRHDCKPCVESGKAKRKRQGKKSAAALKADRARKREKAKAPHRRAANRRHVADWQARNPEAVAAKAAVQKALKAGVIAKPKRCQVRGCQQRDRIEGHHFDYAHPLHVAWLCPGHHKAAHAGHSLEIVRGLHPALLGIPSNLTPKTPKETIRHAFTENQAPRQTRSQARASSRSRSARAAAAQ